MELKTQVVLRNPPRPNIRTKKVFLSVQCRLKLDTEGTYQCTETGLIFEVNRKVDIKYCVLSWSKFADLVVKPWVVGGPLFDVKCDPTCLTSIQFPHSLCLGRKYLFPKCLIFVHVCVCVCNPCPAQSADLPSYFNRPQCQYDVQSLTC